MRFLMFLKGFPILKAYPHNLHIPIWDKPHIVLDKMLNMPHSVHMTRRHLSKDEFKAWRESVGGLARATLLVKEKLECSDSKAEKIASGRYISVPTPTEQMALAALMQRPRDVIFPLVASKRKRPREEKKAETKSA